MLVRPVSEFGSLRIEFMRIGLSNRILSVINKNTRKTLTRENLVIIRVVTKCQVRSRYVVPWKCRQKNHGVNHPVHSYDLICTRMVIK
jgi:hypothetical protein